MKRYLTGNLEGLVGLIWKVKTISEPRSMMRKELVKPDLVKPKSLSMTTALTRRRSNPNDQEGLWWWRFGPQF